MRSCRWPHIAWTALLAAALGGLGCSTNPVNPDGCKDIEEARCRAAPACPAFADFDVDQCLRFYRDQCLHGLSSATDPGKPAIDACVRAIEAAGACARRSTTEPCSLGITTTSDPCEVIAHPEKVAECKFLLPEAEPTPDAATNDAAAESATQDSTSQDTTSLDSPSEEAAMSVDAALDSASDLDSAASSD